MKASGSPIKARYSNPFNSLFSRIFLWFWLVIILIIGSSLWLASEFNNEGKITRVPIYHHQQLKLIAKHLTKASIRNHTSLKKRLKYVARKNHTGLLLYQADDQSFTFSIKEKKRPSQQQVLKLAKKNRVSVLNLSPTLLVGPMDVTIGQKTYQLFMQKYREPSRVRQLKQQHPGLLLLLALTVSGLLCSLLAWSLVKPIRHLQQAVRQMASGDLSTRVDDTLYGKDEIGQLAREFNSMSSQVEALMQGQKQLLADISHELRTPLARLNLVIGIAQENQDIPACHLQRIEKEAQLIEDMVARILQLSRLESRSLQPEKVPLDLISLMQPLLEDAEYEGQGINKQVRTDIPPHLMMTLDPTLMSSAIENVLRNGLKYAKSEVTVSMVEYPQHWAIKIQDDGEGLPQEELDKIFTPFYRVSNARNRNNGGIGLGLAISQQAIAAHNGKVLARNLAPNGLEVEICLPKADEK